MSWRWLLGGGVAIGLGLAAARLLREPRSFQPVVDSSLPEPLAWLLAVIVGLVLLDAWIHR